MEEDIFELAELEMIEANVVVLLTMREASVSAGKVIPLWECELTTAQINTFAVQEALKLNEQLGQGSVIWEVVDFRP
jgi:hypothetical protein